MVLFESGKLADKKWVNIAGLEELRGVTVEPKTIEIRALTTYTDIRRHDVIGREFPLLHQSAAVTGAIAIQNRGTIGGNIVNASPAADSLPPLLVYEAELVLVSHDGERTVPYADFHTGYKTMNLKPGELVKSIRLPRQFTEYHHFYRKVGTRAAQAISKVCFAGVLEISGDRSRRDLSPPPIKTVRIALGSVAPVPLRARRTEAVLTGKIITSEMIRAAQQTLAQEISPIDDIRSTATYRRRVAQNLLGAFLHHVELGR